jgi:hypothetical protein
VTEVLEVGKAAGLARQSLIHLRNDISAVLGDLWRAELLPQNVTKRVRVPKVDRPQKERAVLADLELQQYLSWQHPHERLQARELTARERMLFEETATTLPVDFHSWRRAYCQALADADVNAQRAKALAPGTAPARRGGSERRDSSSQREQRRKGCYACRRGHHESAGVVGWGRCWRGRCCDRLRRRDRARLHWQGVGRTVQFWCDWSCRSQWRFEWRRAERRARRRRRQRCRLRREGCVLGQCRRSNCQLWCSGGRE